MRSGRGQRSALVLREPAIPNLFAYIALCTWPLVTIAIFSNVPFRSAVIWSVVAGYLLLPVNTVIDIPATVDIDKYNVIGLSTFLCALSFAPRTAQFLPRNALLVLLCLIFVISPVATSFFNADPLVFGSHTVKGMTLYDGMSNAQGQIVALLPFLAGHAALRNEDGHKALLKIVAISAVLYVLPMLVEIRLSPQLNRWVYGFFPHSFVQQVRGGSFRPVVFLGHGLIVAIFTCMGVIAVAGLTRYRRKLFDVPTGVFVAVLAGMLFLCRSLGATTIGILAAPLALWARPRLIRVFGAIFAVIVLSYPALRQTDLVPAGGLQGLVAGYSAERAGSFQTRSDNEVQLLAKAMERPWLGWGSWGRNRIYQQGWGSDLSTTDGYWIITFGSSGIVGYIATFGLLCFGLLFRPDFARGPPGGATGCLRLVLIANILDLIPNASISPLTWLIAGALIPAMPNLRKRRTRQAQDLKDKATGAMPQSAPVTVVADPV